jgi:broad specificity phosphatase PhoE
LQISNLGRESRVGSKIGHQAGFDYNQFMKIYLCRHGQTTGDIEDRYGGDYDDHLTKLGRSEAAKLAKELVGKGIEKIYSSSKIRAVETSKILARVLSCKIEVVPDYRERNQNGILTGMVRSEAKLRYPEMAEELKDFKNTIEGAEDYESFSERVHKALFDITNQNHHIVAVVTHGGPIKAVLRKVKYSFDYNIEDCAYAELEVENNKIKVIGLVGIEPKN